MIVYSVYSQTNLILKYKVIITSMLLCRRINCSGVSLSTEVHISNSYNSLIVSYLLKMTD